jgi:hypothetical protein
MKTVLQLLNQAYTKIQVKSKYEDLSDDQKQEGIDELNQMMWEHDASGLPVNWSDVETADETVPEPDWMFSMMANGLAIRLAPNYGVQIDPRIIGMYEAGLDATYKRLVPIPKLLYPNILPTGRSLSCLLDALGIVTTTTFTFKTPTDMLSLVKVVIFAMKRATF